MLELYILVGVILAIGSLLVCKKKDKRLYILIFFIIAMLWPIVAFAAYLKT